MNNGWFPKESAPKDGTWFLVYAPDSPMCWAPYEFAAWQFVEEWETDINGRVEYRKKEYFGETDTSEEIDFDWWQPLPALPLI